MQAVVLLLEKAIHLYIFLLIIWVFSSWFPQWRYQQWFKWINSVVEPYMNLFRGLNLRWQMIDLSPIVAILLLQLIRMGLLNLVYGGM